MALKVSRIRAVNSSKAAERHGLDDLQSASIWGISDSLPRWARLNAIVGACRLWRHLHRAALAIDRPVVLRAILTEPRSPGAVLWKKMRQLSEIA
jgi:hypothetical protein